MPEPRNAVTGVGPAPQDLDAEEGVLGCLLLAGASGPEVGARAYELTRAAGLAASDFYRGSHGAIFSACAQLVSRGDPCDAISVVAELTQSRKLAEVHGGSEQVHVLGALAPAIGNVAHWARLVVAAARRRELASAAERARLAALNADDAAAASALQEAHAVLQIGMGDGIAPPLTWAAAQAETVAAEPALVEGLIEAGTPGLLTGKPYTFKSWLALEIAYGVAAGGVVLGRYAVRQQGPVGYFWYDDGRSQELGRIQRFGADRAPGVPLSVYLPTPGRRSPVLPRDLGWFASEVRRHKFVLVVLDSLYNFVGNLNFREQEAGALIGALKAQVCDATGCAVLILHHSAWKAEGGRAYGDVFQEAAVRWGIHLTRDGNHIVLATRANNMPQVERVALEWDDDAVALTPVELSTPVDNEIVDWVAAHPDATTKSVEDGVGHRRQDVRDALARLVATQRLHEWSPNPGRKRATRHFHTPDACDGAACAVAHPSGATAGDTDSLLSPAESSRLSPTPIEVGDGRQHPLPQREQDVIEELQRSLGAREIEQ